MSSTAVGVVATQNAGHRMLTHMEAALPAGLPRDAAVFLAAVVDDVCTPA